MGAVWLLYPPIMFNERMKSNSTIMFIAGEASGDAHAAALIRALGGRVRTFGAGGPKMKAAGMELLTDLTEHAVVGLVEVLKNYGKFKRIFNQLVAEAERRRPAAVVLVDFPGFNLRFAAAMKKRGIKVIYYISPQLWAWHASRAKQIERDVDLMLVIFPFEKAWYAKHAPKLRVEFVGHPFAERMQRSGVRSQKVVVLLPGSREREVAKIWPVMVGVVDQMPDVKFTAAQPFFQTRTATTKLVVWDGETVVLGGLIREQMTDFNDKIPVLGDIPLLGKLFQSKGSSSVKENLMIFVTARIVDSSGRPLHRKEKPTMASQGAAKSQTETPLPAP